MAVIFIGENFGVFAPLPIRSGTVPFDSVKPPRTVPELNECRCAPVGLHRCVDGFRFARIPCLHAASADERDDFRGRELRVGHTRRIVGSFGEALRRLRCAPCGRVGHAQSDADAKYRYCSGLHAQRTHRNSLPIRPNCPVPRMAKPYQESRLVGAGLTIIQNNPAGVNKTSLLNMLPPPPGRGGSGWSSWASGKGARGAPASAGSPQRSPGLRKAEGTNEVYAARNTSSTAPKLKLEIAVDDDKAGQLAELIMRSVRTEESAVVRFVFDLSSPSCIRTSETGVAAP